MKIRVLGSEEVDAIGATRVNRGGQEMEIEAVAELVRSQSLALGPTPRRVLLDTVARLEGEGIEPDRELLLQTVGRLVETGDLLAGERGRIGPAPLRAVRLTEEAFLLAGAVPTDDLLRELPVTVDVAGAVRRAILHGKDAAAFESGVRNLGGVVVELDRWSGLDRVPPAGQEWIRDLGGAGTAGRKAATADSSEMQVYVPTAEQPIQGRRWKRCAALPSKGLVRWRREGGWHEYAWVVNSEGAELVGLSKDEARRTMFSLDREHGCSVSARTTENEGQIVVEIDSVLPYAEYRALLGLMERTNWREWPVRYQGDRQRAATACAMLEERLGIVCPGMEGGANAEA